MPTAAAERAAYQANIWKSYLFHFLVHFQLWWSIWIVYLQELRGLSLTQVTVLEALFWITAVGAEMPTGAVADRYGRKASLVLGAACSTAAVLVFGLATNYAVLLISYVTWAFGIAFLSGAQHALVFESLKELGREHEFQRVAGRLAALLSFGALVGGLAGAPIAAATDLSIPILLSAAITAPGVLVALTMKEPSLPEGEMRLAYGDLLRESAATALRQPAVASMLLLSSLINACAFGPLVLMQPFLTAHNVDVAFIGLLVTPARITAILGALIAYRITAAIGLRSAFIAAPLILVGGYLWLGTWDAVYAFAAFPLIALINHLLLPTAEHYLNQRIPNNQRATILSLRTMLVSFWIAGLTPALGAVGDAASLQATFLVAATVVALAVPVALVVWLRADASERPALATSEA